MKKLYFILFVFFPLMSFADSPITSANFFYAYNDVFEVRRAYRNGKLDQSLNEFLSNSKNPIDSKLAVANALGWNYNGKNNADLFREYLKKKYKTSILNYFQITKDELLLLGYISILDHYEDTAKPLKIIRLAMLRNRDSYAYHIIYGLALAQFYLSMSEGVNREDEDLFNDYFMKDFVHLKASPGCNMYQIVAHVENNNRLKQDFKEEAKYFIFDYMKLYKENCVRESITVPKITHDFGFSKDKMKQLQDKFSDQLMLPDKEDHTATVTFPEKVYRMGFGVKKIIEYSANKKGKYKRKGKHKTDFELFFTKHLLAFRENDQKDWSFVVWIYSEFDEKENAYVFFDNFGQMILVDKKFTEIKWYKNWDGTRFTGLIMYKKLKTDKEIKLK